jgi:hypothetical protein
MLPRAPHQNFAIISYWLGAAPAGPVRIEVASLDGRQRHRAELPREAGIRRYEWNLRFDPPAGAGASARGAVAGPGSYRVSLTVGGQVSTTTLMVRADPILAQP